MNLAYHGARARNENFNITLEREFDHSLAPLELVPQDMTRVLLNLFDNGFYAAETRRRQARDSIRPVLKVTTRDLGVAVRVRDNGTGIPLELRDKLFRPFVTTKPTGEGTGLGLSISYDIINAAAWRYDRGRQRVRRVRRVHRVHDPPTARTFSNRRRGIMSVSILVVDNEPDVARLFSQRFRRETRRVTHFLHIEIRQRFPDLQAMIGQLPSAPD